MACSTGHVPSVMMLVGAATPSELPLAILVEVFLLNGLLALLAAGLMRRSGFLSAVGIHL